jgi:uncharacterized protein YeaO (DUF488 family)
MIHIKRVYEPASNKDGYRILVDRLWPRGMTKEAARIDLWMKEVAPSDALRKSFSHDVKKWPSFQKKYQNELKKNAALLAELRKMEKEHEIVTLLFGARDEEHNQAVVLANLLKKR